MTVFFSCDNVRPTPPHQLYAMNLHDIELLSQARSAGESIGSLFAASVSDDMHQHLTLLLLNDLSHYNRDFDAPLRHEIAMGLLDAFTREDLADAELTETQRRARLPALTSAPSNSVVPTVSSPRCRSKRGETPEPPVTPPPR